MRTYPTLSDYYSLAIKFDILSLSKFYLFSFGIVCRDKGNLQILIKYAVHKGSSALCKWRNVSLEDVLNHQWRRDARLGSIDLLKLRQKYR